MSESLNDAIRLHQVDLVRRLLSEGADPNERDQDGIPPLYCAASWGHADIVELLLKTEAAIDSRQSKYDMTPLMTASFGGFVSVVKALLDAGADPNARDNANETPLMHAAKRGSLEVVKVLLDAGAHPKAKDDKGRTAVHCSIDRGDFPDVVELLLSLGADAVTPTKHGVTALSEARRKGYKRTVEVLTRHSA